MCWAFPSRPTNCHVLAHAGLHLGATTIARMLKAPIQPQSPRAGQTTATAGRQRPPTEPCLALRPVGRAAGERFLGSLVTLCLAAIFSLLLVGRGCRRSIFPPCHEHRHVFQTTDFRTSACLSRPHDLQERKSLQLTKLTSVRSFESQSFSNKCILLSFYI